jgi:hypothetical protein
MSSTGVPYIDPNVEHVGVSRLRKLNATNLRTFEKALVIQDNDTPLAVLLTYEQFLTMQRELQALLGTIEVLTDDDERAALFAGLEDMNAGKTKSLAKVRASLRKKAQSGDSEA